jgi:DhnA family fructose-bisphosphate aldolase class Ia
MNNKLYRLRELFNPATGRSLVVDTSNGLSLGALPGLEQFETAVSLILPLVDGIVTSPGQSRNLGMRTHQEAALIIRADWTNALRGEDFVLPPEKINYLQLVDPGDAMDIGANAIVMNFLLGHQEDIEAQCLKQVVHLSLQGSKIGMPLIVDVQPIGPRVVLLSKAIELGVSYALEGGADGIAVPWPGEESFEIILKMAAEVPVWVKPSSLTSEAPDIDGALALGGTGLWLSEAVFAIDDPPSTVETIAAMLHRPVEV